MALITESILLDKISGKVGPEVFSSNQFGAYVKQNTPQVFPNTLYQQFWNDRMAQVTIEWRNMSENLKQAWNEAAGTGEWDRPNRLGVMTRPRGRELFMRLNMALAEVGVFYYGPPVKSPMPFFSNFSLKADQGAQTPRIDLKFDVSGQGSNDWYKLFMTPPLSAGITKPKSPLFKSVTLGDLSSWSGSKKIGPAYKTRFGNASTGSKIFAKVSYLNAQTGEMHEVGKCMAIVG